MGEWSLVFLLSAVSCMVAGPLVIRALIARRWIQPLRYEDCPPLMPIQHAKQGTPTMGGIFVLGVAVIVAAVWGGLARVEGWLLCGATLGLGLLGLVDDWLKLRSPNAKGLSLMMKLLVALAIGAAVGALLSRLVPASHRVLIPWAHRSVELGFLWIPLAMVVVAGCAHAVNLTDGMDGLAAGCLAVAFGLLGGWLMLRPSPDRLTALWCASLSGACAGFLWFNSYPASVFLGDVGSLGLGAALGTAALLSHAAVALVVIGGIFVAEAVSVIIQVVSYRYGNHRRVFRIAPLHHHFHVGGIPEPKLVVRFWIAGILLAALGWSALSSS
jgi:phospho-N-acetylmuramoyl-pentapeptide-transferase